MNIENIIITILISCISAWVTMKLALHRFYREKWWDKRATAYLELIDALYDFKEDYGVMQDNEFAKSTPYDGDGQYFIEDILSQEEESEYWKRMLQTQNKLKKLRGLGPLIFTESALLKISAFIKRDEEVTKQAMNHEVDNYDAYSEMRVSAESLYNEFKEVAIYELKLKHHFFRKIKVIGKLAYEQYLKARDDYLANFK